MYLYVQNERFKILLIAVVCLLGSGVSNFLLYRDLTNTGDLFSGQVLASLTRSDGDVQRKHASTFVWRPVGQGADLYRRDSVRGSSLIRFHSGAEMELGEDSLVVIDDTGNLDLNFLQGSVIVRTGTEEKRLSVGKDGKTKVEAIPVRLIEPRLSQVIVAPQDGAAPTAFHWSGLGKTGLQLEVADNRRFVRPIHQVKLAEGPGNALRLNLLPGRYFWRLTENGTSLSDARPFTVIEAPSYSPVWPAHLESAPITHAGDPTVFRWTSAGDSGKAESGGLKLELQVARDSAFQNVLQKQIVSPSAGRAAVSLEAGGPFYWRLVSRYPELEVASPAQSFHVGLQERLRVTLLHPLHQSNYTVEPEQRLTWEFEAPADEFPLRILAGESVVLDEMVPTSRYLWSAPGHGTFRWQVGAFKSGKMIGLSPIEQFTLLEGQPVALQAPAPGVRFEYWKEVPEVPFLWESHSLFKEGALYVWELAKDAHFRKPVRSLQLPGHELNQPKLIPSAGTWFWRVRLVDNQGRNLALSKPARFYFGPPPALDPPANAEPPSGSAIRLEATGGVPVVKWDSVAHATAYELSVRDAKRVVFAKTLKETTARLTSLKQGTYWWTVRAIDPLNRKGMPLAEHEFTVRYGKVLPAPEITRSKLQ